MSFPRYIEMEWHGEGMAVLKFCHRNDENVNLLKPKDAKAGKIECYLSRLNIWEYKAASPGVNECEDDNVDETENRMDELPSTVGPDTKVHLCPPGILPELWQSWLEHWEAWKDVYIPLSWVHKYRKICTPEYVEWHDSYLEDYPWMIPCITDELGSSDCELDFESKNDRNQKDSQGNLDIDEAINVDIHHDSTVSLNKDASEKLITFDGSQSDGEEGDDLNVQVETESTVKKHTVQENSSVQNLAHTDERKEALDALYEKHSTKRYWVHLRSFLQNFGIEANDDINAFFTLEAGIDFNENGRVDSTDDKRLNDRDEVMFKFNEKQCSQDSAARKDMKIEKLSKETDEPVMIQSFPNLRNSVNTLFQDVLHTFDDKLEISHPETKGLQDANDKNIKEHCQKSLHREYHDHDTVTQLKNTCTLINTKLNEDEDKTACDSNFKSFDTEQSIEHAQDDSKYIVDSFKDFVSELSDHSVTDARVLADGHCRKGVMSQVGTEKEQTGIENCSDLTTSSCIKEVVKKKKKSKDSGNFGGLAWALKYVQSQEGQIKKNDGDMQDSVEVASVSAGGGLSDNTHNPTSCLSKDVDPRLCENPLESTVCDSGKPVINDCKDERDSHEKDETPYILGVNDNTAVNCEKENDLCSLVASPENGHIDKWKWNTGADVTAAVKSFFTTGALLALSLMYPLISGISQLLFRVFRVQLPLNLATLPSGSQEPSHLQDERVSGKRTLVDENHGKLYKWLQNKANAPPDASSLNVSKDIVLNGFCKYPDHRETQKAYHSVEETVKEDGSKQLNLETMNLYSDDIQIPEVAKRSLWKEVIAGHRLVNYKEIDECPPPDIPEDLHKYWFQRHRLFLKYDEGIKLDQESWYSVTPEVIALHHAYRCKCDVVVDAFCGAGGNSIQLAMTCNHVIAIDIDPAKIALAHHNAALYGVADRIEFIVGDFFQLAPMLKADVVYLSPPWGGIKYVRDGIYDVKHLDGILNCEELMDVARTITASIALYLPKSSDIYQIIELAGIGGTVDIEFNSMGKKRKSLTAYFGDLVHY